MEAGELAMPLVSGERAEPLSFEEILRAHERGILRTCLRMLGDIEDARDAAQETFMRLHRNLSQFRSGRPVAPWLYQVALNQCRDRLRRRRPSETLELFDPPAEAPHPEALAAREERRRLVLRGLRRLAEGERAALVLRDLEELPTEEVARILGNSEATVRSQIAKARAKLKTILRGVL
jgi:RNA polymerase sigma-70 factor (ECF subfamily)